MSDSDARVSFGASSCPSVSQSITQFNWITCSYCDISFWEFSESPHQQPGSHWTSNCRRCGRDYLRDTFVLRLEKMRTCWSYDGQSTVWKGSNVCMFKMVRNDVSVRCRAPWDGSEVFDWRIDLGSKKAYIIDVDGLILGLQRKNKRVEEGRKSPLLRCDMCEVYFKGKGGLASHRKKCTGEY